MITHQKRNFRHEDSGREFPDSDGKCHILTLWRLQLAFGILRCELPSPAYFNVRKRNYWTSKPPGITFRLWRIMIGYAWN